MSWILLFLILVAMIIAILKSSFFDSPGIKKWSFLLAFAFKLAAGFFLLWIYSHHYTNRSEADVFKYFDDGKVVYDVAETSTIDYLKLATGFTLETKQLTKKYLTETHFWDRSPSLPWLNDNRFMIRFHALLMPLSGENIYLHSLVAIFLAFCGLTFLLHFFIRLRLNPIFSFVLIYFTPSLMLWTSAVLKESFMILALGGMLYYLTRIDKTHVKSLLIFLSFALLLALTRIYVLFILIPLLLAYLWSEDKKDKLTAYRYLSMTFFYVAVILNIGLYVQNLSIVDLIVRKQYEFICLAEWTGAGSIIYIPELETSLRSFVEASPYALANVFFSPLPWQAGKLLSYIAMLEIAFLWMLLIASLILKKRRISISNAYWLSLFFIFCMSLLIGWTSPVVGAIVRYRIVLFPFLFVIILMNLDTKKMIKFVSIFQEK